jgi:hypothetical protein
MRLFGRWRKNSYNNNSDVRISELGGKKKRYSKAAIGQKHGLFDGIVGYDDIRELFYMAIEAERPVHLLLGK